MSSGTLLLADVICERPRIVSFESNESIIVILRATPFYPYEFRAKVGAMFSKKHSL